MPAKRPVVKKTKSHAAKRTTKALGPKKTKIVKIVATAKLKAGKNASRGTKYAQIRARDLAKVQPTANVNVRYSSGNTSGSINLPATFVNGNIPVNVPVSPNDLDCRGRDASGVRRIKYTRETCPVDRGCRWSGLAGCQRGKNSTVWAMTRGAKDHVMRNKFRYAAAVIIVSLAASGLYMNPEYMTKLTALSKGIFAGTDEQARKLLKTGFGIIEQQGGKIVTSAQKLQGSLPFGKKANTSQMPPKKNVIPGMTPKKSLANELLQMES